MTETQPLLSVSHLTKRYGSFTALDDISFTLPRGRIIGLLGPNGSGKTTFIKLAAGLLRPSGGNVLINGSPIGTETKARVAYLPERNSIPAHFTVAEAVRYYDDFFADFDKERAVSMLQTLGLPSGAVIKALSKGSKEKLQLVMVMSRRAELYLLDEPISGVDPAARDFIIETILSVYSPEASILISTHLISDIERVMHGFLLMKNGKIHSVGTPEGLREKTGKTVDEYFREVFKC